ncbi:MAG: hypothetical protein WC716_13025 [Chitinophagaceae bacterium]
MIRLLLAQAHHNQTTCCHSLPTGRQAQESIALHNKPQLLSSCKNLHLKPQPPILNIKLFSIGRFF